jgi:beta-galactosidase
MNKKLLAFKYVFALVIPVFFSTAIYCQTFGEWHDPAINQINRAPMRASFFAYESAELSKTDIKENSSHFISLNGTWKFSFVNDADKRPIDFFKPNYNDFSWDKMEVPAIWEVNGYGDPVYVNSKFAWHHIMDPEPPKVPTKDNYVGSYRRTIDIPSNWNDKEVFINMGAVSSAVYLWVNGQFVGYS